VTSSVAEYVSAETNDVIRPTQQRKTGDVTASRDGVLHWCYSKYLQVRPR